MLLSVRKEKKKKKNFIIATNGEPCIFSIAKVFHDVALTIDLVLKFALVSTVQVVIDLITSTH